MNTAPVFVTAEKVPSFGRPTRVLHRVVCLSAVIRSGITIMFRLKAACMEEHETTVMEFEAEHDRRCKYCWE